MASPWLGSQDSAQGCLALWLLGPLFCHRRVWPPLEPWPCCRGGAGSLSSAAWGLAGMRCGPCSSSNGWAKRRRWAWSAGTRTFSRPPSSMPSGLAGQAPCGWGFLYAAVNNMVIRDEELSLVYGLEPGNEQLLNGRESERLGLRPRLLLRASLGADGDPQPEVRDPRLNHQG